MAEFDIYRALGKAVALRRKELKLTQSRVAALCGMSRAALANIETGRQSVMLHQVFQLAQALGLDDIALLIPKMSNSGAGTSSMAVWDSKLTGVQKQQVDRVVQELRAAGKPIGRRSS